ncbi:MAG: hypothetical protein K1Y01_00085 [Vicinamibacteria bacterium]|nr:hypothetical protein [Vicinamibacteria bacterium]
MLPVFLALLLSGPAAAAPRVVAQQEILEAMNASQGYNVTATTNGPRFQAEVLMRLARQARAERPDGPALLIGHAEWFHAFLERAGLPKEKAPAYMRLSYEHQQDLEIDYRADRVIDDAGTDRPAFAAIVRMWWPERPGAPSSYSYVDLSSTPQLKVTNQRVIVYRLLEVNGMVVYGRIEGLRGRPTSGLLGALFQLIGEGDLKESRMMLSHDGLQISRTRAEKWTFGVTQTVTVYPDGRAEKDIPANRPDLVSIAARLQAPLTIRYRP